MKGKIVYAFVMQMRYTSFNDLSYYCKARNFLGLFFVRKCSQIQTVLSGAAVCVARKLEGG